MHRPNPVQSIAQQRQQFSTPPAQQFQTQPARRAVAREYSSVGAISILPLPYRIDGCDYFAQLRPLAGAVFLDSARVHGAGGRFDLMSALPVCELRTHGAITRITRRCMSVPSTADPFELVAQALATDLPEAHIEQESTLSGGASLWRAQWSEGGDPFAHVASQPGRTMTRGPGWQRAASQPYDASPRRLPEATRSAASFAAKPRGDDIMVTESFSGQL